MKVMWVVFDGCLFNIQQHKRMLHADMTNVQMQ